MMFCAWLSDLLLCSDVIVFPKLGTVAGKEMLATEILRSCTGTLCLYSPDYSPESMALLVIPGPQDRRALMGAFEVKI